MRILVTGANGFVGSHAVRHLSAAGHEIRAAVRQAGLAPPGVQVVTVHDYRDPRAVASAVAGVDAVIHLAARVHVLREDAADPLEAFRAVNVEGTRVLAECARRAGARHFVLASSLSVVGSSSREAWTEATPTRPETDYGRSKLEAEERLLELASPEFSPTALRIPLTYGPGVTANMLRFLRWIDRGVPLPIAMTDNARSFMAVGNLVRAFEAALHAGPAASGAFFVSDDRDLSTRALAELAGDALGRPPRLLPLPGLILDLVGRAGDLANRVRHFPVSSRAMQQLVGNLQVRVGRFTAATGFRPSISVEAALLDTAHWMRSGVSFPGERIP